MTASADVRLAARDYLVYAALASVIGVFAFTYDGIYIGATWTRDMRNLMIVVARALFRGVVADAGRSAIPGCGSRSWSSSARAARCRRRAIRRWRGRRSSRPRLRGDRRGVAADRIGERVEPPDAQEIEQVRLDRADQPDAAEDQPV